MVRIKGIGEKPFSVAYDNPLTIVVKKIGRFTSALFNLKKGGKVFVRGPYGNSFPTKDGCLVAGGTGIAPLYFLANRIKKPKILIGTKSKDELVFISELKELCDVKIATEDGSIGNKGFVTSIIEKSEYYFNCGPEAMIKKAIEIEMKYTKSKRIFSSIERYMKCGVGLCGSCSCSGHRVCVDGPVFTAKQLEDMGEFGKYKRDASGKRINA